MAKTREKKLVIQGVTREQADEAFAAFADADARLQQVTSRMDVEITRVREKYQDILADLQRVKDDNFDILQSYATEQKTTLFKVKKSLETVHGTMGFRTGTPKLKPLKGFTWGAITMLLKEFLPQYVRITEEPAKDKLLADRDNPDVMELFPRVGVYVDQDETFFVEPKKEEVDSLIR